MSALVGVVSPAGSEEARALTSKLAAAHAFRGVHTARWEKAAVSLAMISNDAATSPWSDEELVVIADARIDNRFELAEDLNVEASTSDLELIARAYKRWKHEWPAHVVGDFSAAIWNERRRELSLARDAIGVRCLYWTRDDRGFRFATEMRPLVDSRARRSPDPLQMALFLIDEYDEREATLFQGVEAVPPAHVLLVRGDVRARRYWHAGGRESVERRPAECAAAFRTVFERAVKARLSPKGSSVALQISGGQDSTSVASVATSLLRSDDRSADAFLTTLTFAGLECDERRYTRAVSDHLRLPLLEVDPLESPTLLSLSLPRKDEYYHPTLDFLRLQLHRSAMRGARVLLTGLGSDQFVHREPVEEAADALANASLRQLHSAVRAFGSWRLLAPAAAHAALSDRVRYRIARLRSTNALLTHTTHGREIEEVLVSRLEALQRLPHRDRTQLVLLRWLQHSPTAPLAVLDRMGARAGVELRHPFLDRRVVEQLFAMPHWVVAGEGTEFKKPLLRRALCDVLPAVILERRTITHFDSFVVRALFECGSDPRHLLRNGLVRQSRLLSEAAVTRMLRDPTSTANLRRFTDWVALEVWLRELESPGDAHGRKV